MRKAMKEERVIINGAVSIGATVSYMEKERTSPAVILIMGTGKTDRDGNQKGFQTDLYKNLAALFVSNGFVCLRYDKRGTYETGGNYNTAGLTDLTDDAISVIKYAKQLTYVDSDKIIVCGHSEGVMIASLLTEKEDVAGLLLLGGAGLGMKEALFHQNYLAVEEFKSKKGILGLLLRGQANQEKADAKVKALFDKCTKATKERVFFAGAMMNAKWVREHGSYSSEDYVELLKKYNKPILAITGTADLSANYRSLEALKDMEHIQTYAPEKVNHILREIDDDNSMMTLQKQYKRLAKQPIHKETQETIEEWLARFKNEN